MTSSQAITLSRCANTSGGRGLLLAGLALAAAAASGCVPFPVTSGPFADSRTNVPAEVPPTIVTGRTTRREVLFGFGEPDGAGTADRWYSYGSAISHGGVGGLFGGAAGNSMGWGYVTRESVEYRRLFVRFDNAGVVSDVRVDIKHCPFWSSTELPTSTPCLDIRGGDVSDQTGLGAGGNERPSLSESAASVMPKTGQAVLGHYRYVIRREGDCPVQGRPSLQDSGYPGELRILPDALLFTIPAQGQSQRSAFIEHPAVSTRVPLVQVESVDAVKGPMLWAWVNVRMKDGSCSSVQFTGYTKAQQAAQLIRQHIGEP